MRVKLRVSLMWAVAETCWFIHPWGECYCIINDNQSGVNMQMKSMQHQVTTVGEGGAGHVLWGEFLICIFILGVCFYYRKLSNVSQIRPVLKVLNSQSREFLSLYLGLCQKCSPRAALFRPQLPYQTLLLLEFSVPSSPPEQRRKYINK